MSMLGDHPEIESIMRTGYPTYAQPRDIYCGECGKDITDDDQYEDEHYAYLCRECLLYFHKKGF